MLLRRDFISTPAAVYVLLAGLTLLTGYRLALIPLQHLPLFYDEAYYYFWSLTPDWGYFSKPPMVGWLIHVTTLMSSSELAVKLAAPLLYTATALLIAAIGSRLFDRRTGISAGLIFITMPLVSFNSLFITTDAPLLFFWALTLLWLVLALQTDQWRYWLAAGLAGGLGMLSKYTMVLLPLSILIYVSVDREQRRQWRNPRLWLGFSLAGVIFLPNLLWNYANQFVSFEHTREISQLDRQLLHPDHLLEFASGQWLAFGLVPMVGFVLLALRRHSYSDARLRLLLCLCLPYLTLMLVLALLSRANQNWAAPVYVAASLLAAVGFTQGSHTRYWRLLGATLVTNLLIMLVFYHYHSLQQLAGIEPSRKNDPYHRLLGWPQLGTAFSRWQQQYPDARLLSGSRKLLAYLGYYSGDYRQPEAAQKLLSWNPDRSIRNQYELSNDLERATPGRFLFVSERALSPAELGHFAHSQLLAIEKVAVYPDLSRHLYIYLTEDFRGYDAPASPQPAH